MCELCEYRCGTMRLQTNENQKLGTRGDALETTFNSDFLLYTRKQKQFVFKSIEIHDQTISLIYNAVQCRYTEKTKNSRFCFVRVHVHCAHKH